jgi:hypothetical protein
VECLNNFSMTCVERHSFCTVVLFQLGFGIVKTRLKICYLIFQRLLVFRRRSHGEGLDVHMQEEY